jgi:hypothetical protein
MNFTMERLSNLTLTFIENHVLHWHPYPEYGMEMPFITETLKKFLEERDYTCSMVDMYSSQAELDQLDAELAATAMLITPPNEEHGTLTRIDIMQTTPFWAEQESESDEDDEMPDANHRETAKLYTEWLEQYLFTNTPLPVTEHEHYESDH